MNKLFATINSNGVVTKIHISREDAESSNAIMNANAQTRNTALGLPPPQLECIQELPFERIALNDRSRKQHTVYNRSSQQIADVMALARVPNDDAHKNLHEELVKLMGRHSIMDVVSVAMAIESREIDSQLES